MARASLIMGYKKCNHLGIENRHKVYPWTIFMAWSFVIPWLFFSTIRMDKIIWVKWPCDSLQIMRWNGTNHRTFWRSSQNNLTARTSQLLLFHLTHWQPALYQQGRTHLCSTQPSSFFDSFIHVAACKTAHEYKPIFRSLHPIQAMVNGDSHHRIISFLFFFHA